MKSRITIVPGAANTARTQINRKSNTLTGPREERPKPRPARNSGCQRAALAAEEQGSHNRAVVIMSTVPWP